MMTEGIFDCVSHLATNSDISIGINRTDLDLNLKLQTTTSVLEGVKASKTKKLKFSSTGPINGWLPKSNRKLGDYAYLVNAAVYVLSPQILD